MIFDCETSTFECSIYADGMGGESYIGCCNVDLATLDKGVKLDFMKLGLNDAEGCVSFQIEYRSLVKSEPIDIAVYRSVIAHEHVLTPSSYINATPLKHDIADVNKWPRLIMYVHIIGCTDLTDDSGTRITGKVLEKSFNTIMLHSANPYYDSDMYFELHDLSSNLVLSMEGANEAHQIIPISSEYLAFKTTNAPICRSRRFPHKGVLEYRVSFKYVQYASNELNNSNIRQCNITKERVTATEDNLNNLGKLSAPWFNLLNLIKKITPLTIVCYAFGRLLWLIDILGNLYYITVVFVLISCIWYSPLACRKLYNKVATYLPNILVDHFYDATVRTPFLRDNLLQQYPSWINVPNVERENWVSF